MWFYLQTALFQLRTVTRRALPPRPLPRTAQRHAQKDEVVRVAGRVPVRVGNVPGFGHGLPVGLQIIGKFFDEGRIIQAASAFEAARGQRNLLATL